MVAPWVKRYVQTRTYYVAFCVAWCVAYFSTSISPCCQTWSSTGISSSQSTICVFLSLEINLNYFNPYSSFSLSCSIILGIAWCAKLEKFLILCDAFCVPRLVLTLTRKTHYAALNAVVWTILNEPLKMAFKARSQGQSLFNSRASPNTHFSWKIQLSRGSQS